MSLFNLPSFNNLSPSSKVELYFSCKNLRDMDTFSKSDPQIFAFMQDNSNLQWYLVGKTEKIDNNLNPKFSLGITVEYYFETIQKMKFSVLDIDGNSLQFQDHDLLGEFSCTLGEIMGSRGQTIRGALLGKKGVDCGVIQISGEEIRDMKVLLTLQLAGLGLSKKDFFGKSDPFVRISRVKSDNTFQAIHTTEVIKNNLDPVWREFSIPLQKLCNGNRERQLLFECFDWNKSGKEDFIGSFTANVTQLEQNFHNKVDFALINEYKRAKKKTYVNDGVLRISKYVEETVPTFLDYISGGCEISLVAAVDFTASNGHPSDPRSLHFLGGKNAYQTAMESVGNILNHYNTSGKIPCFGFGAILPTYIMGGGLFHCFPLTGNPGNPEVEGVSGLLQAYQQMVQIAQLHGPTNFAEIIRVACHYANPQYCGQERQRYTILLILTDGVITDMDETVREIVEASKLPLSIVIVGVGSADFTNMNILDGDDQRLSHHGVVSSRDIVQFVPYREFQNSHPGKLAEMTLAEIPDQLLSYMKMRKISPNVRHQPPENIHMTLNGLFAQPAQFTAGNAPPFYKA